MRIPASRTQTMNWQTWVIGRQPFDTTTDGRVENNPEARGLSAQGWEDLGAIMRPSISRFVNDSRLFHVHTSSSRTLSIVIARGYLCRRYVYSSNGCCRDRLQRKCFMGCRWTYHLGSDVIVSDQRSTLIQTLTQGTVPLAVFQTGCREQALKLCSFPSKIDEVRDWKSWRSRASEAPAIILLALALLRCLWQQLQVSPSVSALAHVTYHRRLSHWLANVCTILRSLQLMRGPAEQRRVRTGCFPCRKRRRKCEDQSRLTVSTPQY